MSQIQDEKYKNDPRISCRYGEKCYQRNSAHLEKYKHPPKITKRKGKPNANPETVKRTKLEETKDEDTVQSQSAVTKKEYLSSSDSESSSDIKNEHLLNEMKNNFRVSCSEEPTVKNEKINAQIESEQKCEDNSEENIELQDELVEKTDKPFDAHRFIKTRFLLDLPSDFFEFWEFCKELKETDPSNALKDVGLTLVGPFDVLAGKFKHLKKSRDEYLRHWRYYYDPPEVLTVIKGDNNTGYHIGYFYDSPDEAPTFLVSNYGTKDGVFSKLGDNIFAAVIFYLDDLKKTGDPFKKMHIGKILAALKIRAEKLKLNISLQSEKMKERAKKVVTKTFNKIGLVVPYSKKTQLGYRDLAMDDKKLMVLLNKLEKSSPEQKAKYLSDLQPVLTYANIALDECDFGTGVKLGWELLYHGIDSLNSTIAQFLGNSYRLLKKEPFAKIIEAHMSNRKKGSDLSII